MESHIIMVACVGVCTLKVTTKASGAHFFVSRWTILGVWLKLTSSGPDEWILCWAYTTKVITLYTLNIPSDTLYSTRR